MMVLEFLTFLYIKYNYRNVSFNLSATGILLNDVYRFNKTEKCNLFLIFYVIKQTKIITTFLFPT